MHRNPDAVGRAWLKLTRRLGYEGNAPQGGELGAVVLEAMAHRRPWGLPNTPEDVAKVLNSLCAATVIAY